METKKRIYVGLVLCSLALLLVLLSIFWWILFADFPVLQHQILILGGLFLTTLFLVSCVGISGIIIALWTQKPVFIGEKFILTALELFSPFILRIGKFFDVDKEQIENSFIEVNNQLVKTKKLFLQPEQILLLLPHCLQKDICSHKITINIKNCHHCGACPVGDLIDLAEKYKIQLTIVTGGTVARKRLLQMKPKAIIAVACQRDLLSGIQDAYPLPVLGILNERPEGPCHNTLVDLRKIEQNIQYLLQDKEKIDAKASKRNSLRSPLPSGEKESLL